MYIYFLSVGFFQSIVICKLRNISFVNYFFASKSPHKAKKNKDNIGIIL